MKSLRFGLSLLYWQSDQMEFVSAGMGEVNECREENALREWLEGYEGYEGDYTPELQAEWVEWVAENEPQYDKSYD